MREDEAPPSSGGKDLLFLDVAKKEFLRSLAKKKMLRSLAVKRTLAQALLQDGSTNSKQESLRFHFRPLSDTLLLPLLLKI